MVSRLCENGEEEKCWLYRQKQERRRSSRLAGDKVDLVDFVSLLASETRVEPCKSPLCQGISGMLNVLWGRLTLVRIRLKAL